MSDYLSVALTGVSDSNGNELPEMFETIDIPGYEFTEEDAFDLFDLDPDLNTDRASVLIECSVNWAQRVCVDSSGTNFDGELWYELDQDPSKVAYIELEGDWDEERYLEAYAGEYSSDADFAEELVTEIGDLPRGIPSYIHIDWEATARDLMYDYREQDGYYFRCM